MKRKRELDSFQEEVLKKLTALRSDISNARNNLEVRLHLVDFTANMGKWLHDSQIIHTSLPMELRTEILYYLAPKEQVNLATSCSVWNKTYCLNRYVRLKSSDVVIPIFRDWPCWSYSSENDEYVGAVISSKCLRVLTNQVEGAPRNKQKLEREELLHRYEYPSHSRIANSNQLVVVVVGNDFDMYKVKNPPLASYYVGEWKCESTPHGLRVFHSTVLWSWSTSPNQTFISLLDTKDASKFDASKLQVTTFPLSPSDAVLDMYLGEKLYYLTEKGLFEIDVFNTHTQRQLWNHEGAFTSFAVCPKANLIFFVCQDQTSIVIKSLQALSQKKRQILTITKTPIRKIMVSGSYLLLETGESVVKRSICCFEIFV